MPDSIFSGVLGEAGPGTLVPGGITLVQAAGGGGSPQNVNPASIASAEAFGTVQLNQTTPAVGGIASAEAFGLVRVDQSVVVAGIPSAEAFGVSRFDQSVFPASIPSAEAFGPVTIDGGDVVISPLKTRTTMGAGE